MPLSVAGAIRHNLQKNSGNAAYAETVEARGV